MIVIRIDSHKCSRTPVAVDATGRKLAEVTVGTTSAGHLEPVARIRALIVRSTTSSSRSAAWSSTWPRFRSRAAFARYNGSARVASPSGLAAAA